jgi:hypothetical protein
LSADFLLRPLHMPRLLYLKKLYLVTINHFCTREPSDH